MDDNANNEIRSPLKAIKAKCLDCSGDSRNEVKMCPIRTCPIYPFRFGKNPYLKRTLSDEQKEIATNRIKEVNDLKRSNK